MSHFYGTMKGSRGEATRCGTKKSGMVITAASWNGAIQVQLYHGSDGVDYVIVRETQWHGQGRNRVLYDGKIGGEK